MLNPVACIPCRTQQFKSWPPCMSSPRPSLVLQCSCSRTHQLLDRTWLQHRTLPGGQRAKGLALFMLKSHAYCSVCLSKQLRLQANLQGFKLRMRFACSCTSAACADTAQQMRHR
jgi:hypothetical protein